MKVLMIGPSRKVQGGISAVVNVYYEAGLGELADFAYLGTMVDGSKIRKLLVAITAFVKFLMAIKKYDILHAHMGSLPSFYRKSVFIYCAKKLNKKIIIHLHGGDFQNFYQPKSSIILKKCIKKIFGYADKVIALSASWQEFLSTFVESNKIEVIYNGVPVPTNFTKNYHETQMLFLGRVVREKGIFDLLDIMPEIAVRYPEVKLIIGGEGDLLQLQKVIQQHHLHDNVVLTGWVTGAKKEKYLEESTIFILPSYNEGLPMSLLEAMSYKCSAVTTNVGGIPEVIRHEINGYMVEPGDLEKMKDIILGLLESRNTRLRIGEQAYSDILAAYSCERSINKLHRVYLDTGLGSSIQPDRRGEENENKLLRHLG